MNLETELDEFSYGKLRQILTDAGRQHASRHVTSIGSAPGLSLEEYIKKFDLKSYQRAQKEWFVQNFKRVYQEVFPHGPPLSFIPNSPIRNDIYYSGIVTPARRMFMAIALGALTDAIRTEWKTFGAKKSPKAAIYF